MSEAWRDDVRFVATYLEHPQFSASKFLSYLRSQFTVSIPIESVAEARKLIVSLLECETLSAANLLLNPAAPEPGIGEVSKALDVAAAKASWKISYTGYDKVLDSVAGQLRSYASEWDPRNKYVPLTSVVQSSGWGKSRLLQQLWSRDMYVFYISCMGEKKTGYPFRTPHLADVLLKGSESDVIALLASIMSVLGSSTRNCREWVEWQQDQESGHGVCYDKVWEEYQAIRGSLVAPEFVAGNSSVSHYMRCLKVYGGVLGPLVEKLQAEKKFLLLCVDEAMDLGMEQYPRVRRALKYIPAGGCFFAVALGTDSTVSSLAGSSLDDPSARVRFLNSTNQLYDPIWLVGCSDVLVSSGSDGLLDTSPDTVLQFGRPLWAGYMRCLDSIDKGRVAVVQLAKKKLLGGERDLADSSKWVTRDVAVAVLGTLIGLDVVAWGTLPQQAAARHMRSIVKISEDKYRVYTAAAAEPALAVAAAELLHLDVLRFVEMLTEICVDGLVLEGVRGEMVSRLVLLLAMHECTKSKQYIASVSLRDFLTKLYGEEIVEQLRDSCVNMEHQLFFNYFVATRSKPSNRRLRECYRRNAALICRRNESCVDLHLPTQLVTGSGITDACVVLQVKNLRGNVASKTDGDERVNQILSEVQNVGAGKDDVRVEDGVLVVEGLGCNLIEDEKLRCALMNLTKVCENELKGMSSEQVALLEDFVPLAYKQMTDKRRREEGSD